MSEEEPQEAGRGKNRLGSDVGELSGVMIIFCILTGIQVTQMYVFIKTQGMADLRFMHLTLQIYSSK